MHRLIQVIRSHWRYRDLLRNLVYRDLKVRFQGTAFGFLWSFVVPIVMISLYDFVFAHVFHTTINNFTLYLVIGVLHYNLFSQVLNQSCDSLINAGSLLQKIYFPRVLVPLSNVTFNFILWFTSIIILTIAMPFLGGHYDWHLLAYFVALMAYLAMILGIALALSVLSVEYRDLRHLVEVGLIILFWCTPIVYDTTTLNDSARQIIALNPLYYYFSIFHDLLYRDIFPDWTKVAAALLWTVTCLAFGTAIYWRKAKWLVEAL
jgi:lipopolysaccharide transport system permease protein